MADKQRQFRKGHISRNSKNPYQDPTYLSFTLIFDTTSPLFNKEVAVKALREFYLEEERAQQLEAFIDTMLLINREMPWYWVSLDGVMRAFDHDFLEPYWGGNEALLTITCNETINLAITGLMDLYRSALYDFNAFTQILPENYRKFRMWIVVSEVRDIQTEIQTSRTAKKQINTDLTGDFKPLFKIQYDFCSFDHRSAKEAFETLSNVSPESPSPKIVINYESLHVVETSYLHGLMTEEIGNQGIENQIDSNNLVRSVGDRLSGDLSNIVRDTANSVQRSLGGMNPSNLFNGEKNVYGSKFEQFYESAIRDLDSYAGGLARVPENIYKDAAGAGQASLNSLKQSISQNIFGENYATLGAAIRQGSLNAIFPLINKP